jgi:integrase
MPSLWKHPRSPFFFCCYTDADGLRRKKSTKQTERKKAWEVCLAIDRAETQARNGTLTEQTAKKLISDILERTTGDKLQHYSAREWFKHWLHLKEQVRARSTADRYEQVVRDFLASLGARANLSLAQITSKDVLAYRDSLIAKKTGPRTANLAITIIRAALNAAVRQGHLAFNPTLALESLAIDAEEKGTFTPAQISALVRAADDSDWRGAVLFGYYTGARISDVCNMRWESIDLQQKLIRFTPRKTKKKQLTIPLHPQLERELLKNPGVGKAFLFPTLAGKITGGGQGLSTSFAALMQRAGIEAKVTRSHRRAVSSLTFHSLRHSFNSALANAGIAQEIRQKLTGHASIEMNRRYTHHEDEVLRAAITVLPNV